MATTSRSREPADARALLTHSASPAGSCNKPARGTEVVLVLRFVAVVFLVHCQSLKVAIVVMSSTVCQPVLFSLPFHQ